MQFDFLSCLKPKTLKLNLRARANGYLGRKFPLLMVEDGSFECVSL